MAISALSASPLFARKTLVGAVGIEPTTFGLKGRCSTTELRPCKKRFALRFQTDFGVAHRQPTLAALRLKSCWLNRVDRGCPSVSREDLFDPEATPRVYQVLRGSING